VCGLLVEQAVPTCPGHNPLTCSCDETAPDARTRTARAAATPRRAGRTCRSIRGPTDRSAGTRRSPTDSGGQGRGASSACRCWHRSVGTATTAHSGRTAGGSGVSQVRFRTDDAPHHPASDGAVHVICAARSSTPARVTRAGRRHGRAEGGRRLRPASPPTERAGDEVRRDSSPSKRSAAAHECRAARLAAFLGVRGRGRRSVDGAVAVNGRRVRRAVPP